MKEIYTKAEWAMLTRMGMVDCIRAVLPPAQMHIRKNKDHVTVKYDKGTLSALMGKFQMGRITPEALNVSLTE